MHSRLNLWLVERDVENLSMITMQVGRMKNLNVKKFFNSYFRNLEQIQLLKDLLSREAPLRQLEQILGRTPSDIEDKAKEIGDHDKKVGH